MATAAIFRGFFGVFGEIVGPGKRRDGSPNALVPNPSLPLKKEERFLSLAPPHFSREKDKGLG